MGVPWPTVHRQATRPYWLELQAKTRAPARRFESPEVGARTLRDGVAGRHRVGYRHRLDDARVYG
ncbi:MAG: hypothetical protein AVDCRST_MAG49-4259 [uncultured Thermomicrobiales bacterium]|uniref:Uncharacterized protein n=1 Tax=uncultured Thermomicrobiales bacterium TaxID=1645740 RepID=A0A6J4VEQ3_9BACT|nr:MAG: hypothetical protein AVDCRST_MAG49-4259 [uncultured Thermomicrobiales bacterium]